MPYALALLVRTLVYNQPYFDDGLIRIFSVPVGVRSMVFGSAEVGWDDKSVCSKKKNTFISSII